MTFTDFRCEYCGQTSSVSTARLADSGFIRCDHCFAISALSRGQRLALVNVAPPPVNRKLGLVTA
jgi:hypothetical protein